MGESEKKLGRVFVMPWGDNRAALRERVALVSGYRSGVCGVRCGVDPPGNRGGLPKHFASGVV